MKSLAKLGAAALVVIVVAIVAVMLLFGGGEKAKIEAMLRQAVDDARAGDAQKCIGYISPQYRDAEGSDYERICATVRQTIGPGKWKEIALRSIDVETSDDTASAALQFWLEPGQPYMGMRERFPLKLILTLRKGDDGWKITSHQVAQR